MRTMETPVSLAKVAVICHVNRKTVLRWVKERKLKAFKTPGGHFRVWADDISNFIKVHKLDVRQGLAPLHKKSIFVVDDEADMRELVAQFLLSDFPEIEVRKFQTGYEAMLELNTCKPEIIILDLMMPYFNGFEMMRAVDSNSDNYKPKIIILSGFLEDEMVSKVKDSIASDWLQKPVAKDLLITAVKKILEREI